MHKIIAAAIVTAVAGCGASQAQEKPLWGIYTEIGSYWAQGGQGYVLLWNHPDEASAAGGFLDYCLEKYSTDECFEHPMYIFSKGVTKERYENNIYEVRHRCIMITEGGGDIVRSFHDTEQEARHAYERELDPGRATGNTGIASNMKEIICNAR